MKANQTNRDGRNLNVAASIKSACLACYEKALVRVAQVKASIIAESRRDAETPETLVRLALNEAEALAWQTNYPHLLFPTLAAEKVQAVARWTVKQQLLREANPEFAFAA